jgi:hypothetical protein
MIEHCKLLHPSPPSLTTSITKPSMVIHTCNLSYSGDGGRKILSLKPAGGKLARLILKLKYKHSAGGIAQVVQLFPSMCQVLLSTRIKKSITICNLSALSLPTTMENFLCFPQPKPSLNPILPSK